MSKRLIITIFLSVLLAVPAAAQAYQAPEVKISQDKVRVNGKSYYAHVVTERQTLYSISKAYNVSLQDIYDSNKNLDLENAGLKVGQVIFIPTKPSKTAAANEPEPVEEVTPPAKPVVVVPYPTEPVPEEPKKENKKEETEASTGSSALDRWLFPGKGKKTEEPVATEEEETPAVTEQLPPVDTTAIADSLAKAESANAFVLDIPERVKVAVVLPFTSSRLSDNTVDFYSGLLLAARDLGKSGIALDIDAIDVRDSAFITPASLSDHDIIIGPITSKDMQVVLAKCPEGKLVVSPLDPQSVALSKDFPSIQAPTPTATQNEDIVRWAIEDMQPGDSLVLITSKGAPLSEGSNCIVEALKASGVKYHTISYGILEGLQIQKAFEWHCSANGTTRYIVAADDESFVNDAVRNVNLMLFKKHDVALYAPSRIRSFNMIETEYLHSVNTHISAAYFTDFNTKNVSNFIMAYRALYNAEPNQFAFHGYDTMHFFVNICRTYGRQWPKVLQDYSERGMQTDFRFMQEEGTKGFINAAVRRVVYTPEYKIVLL
ncbi:MAG: LysM peptidoglycan-binding domain-containing protein [Bacteroidales bacterium]|nr:LysM peptidoglycan-binding domain-containing protein [Bacteroidales bacterium]